MNRLIETFEKLGWKAEHEFQLLDQRFFFFLFFFQFLDYNQWNFILKFIKMQYIRLLQFKKKCFQTSGMNYDQNWVVELIEIKSVTISYLPGT